MVRKHVKFSCDATFDRQYHMYGELEEIIATALEEKEMRVVSIQIQDVEQEEDSVAEHVTVIKEMMRKKEGVI